MPQIAQRLAEGDPVLLFGEGTAGDGNRVLPFRTALIGAARDAIAAAGRRAAGLDPAALDRLCEPAGHPARAPSAPARRLVRQDEAGTAYRRDRPHRRGRCRRSPGASRSPTTAQPTARRLARHWNARSASSTIAALRGKPPSAAGRLRRRGRFNLAAKGAKTAATRPAGHDNFRQILEWVSEAESPARADERSASSTSNPTAAR